ncbi:MAG: DUF460 domain-containing protein [Candidatus Aenigmarchaeota archaeon]|nr:DUF460 domain-containing protein [Candidatus Aenigmarchaeota archaeon]
MVGYDPGEKIGLAVIDTFGRIVLLTSKNSSSIANISQIILKYGKPIIVATDRKPLPKSVEKLAKSVGAKVYVPPETLGVREKSDIVKRYEIRVKNNHERDAVASALKAYKHYVSLFRKVNTSLNSLGLNSIYNKVLESLIFGHAENLDEAINKALSVREFVEEKKVEKPVKVEKRIDVKRLERDVEILRKYNERLEEEIKRLKERKPKVKIVFAWDELNKLKDNLEYVKKLRRLEVQGKTPIIDVDSSTVEDVNKNIDLFGRVVFVKEKNLEFLNKYGVKACVTDKDVDKGKLEFPVIQIKEDEIKAEEGIKYVESSLVENKIREARKIGLIEWIKDYKKRRI